MCRANLTFTSCVACDWLINRTFDVMVHCEVFWQTAWCPRAEYPITEAYARDERCARCNPPPWQRDVAMQPREDADMQTQEDVEMQPQEDVDMELEVEARSSDETLSVERAEPGNRLKELIDEVARRSAEEDERNDRDRRDESSRTTLSPEFYYITRAGRQIPAPRGTPTTTARRTCPDHPAT